MSTNENKQQPKSEDPVKEVKEENLAANSDKKTEYKGNNPGGQSVAK
jgi:hypothetical protein